MRTTILTGLAALGAITTCTGAQTGVPGLYPTVISDSDAPTSLDFSRWLGPPDDLHTGLGENYITYDFLDFRIIDGAGPDLNVYEVDGGVVEFGEVDVLVSANGVDFFSINSTIGDAVDLIGDEAHGDARFRKSFDLGPSGLTEVRYVKLQGTGGGAAGGDNDFDPDAIGAINFVPTPGVLVVGGLGLVAGARRRR